MTVDFPAVTVVCHVVTLLRFGITSPSRIVASYTAAPHQGAIRRTHREQLEIGILSVMSDKQSVTTAQVATIQLGAAAQGVPLPQKMARDARCPLGGRPLDFNIFLTSNVQLVMPNLLVVLVYISFRRLFGGIPSW